MRLEVRSPGYATTVTRPSTPEIGSRFVPVEGDDARYSLALRLRLVDLGLAEVVVVDGVPGVAVDPIFEAARAAALAGIDDRYPADAKVPRSLPSLHG